MEYPKEVTVKNYFDIHNFYQKIYGSKTIILMQVGSFHECYSTDTDGLNLTPVSEYLDVIVTKKNKNKPLSRGNPRMMGFPIYTIHDFTEKLVNFGYTVVVIDQISDPPSPKRGVTGIYSPTTFLDKNSNYSVTKSSNLICLVIDALRTKQVNKVPLLCVGIACYDLTTGEGSVYETVSTNNDTMYALDDTIRFLENYPPCEIIFDVSTNLAKFLEINNKIHNMSINDIIAYLGINENDHKLYKIHNLENLSKISYQKMFLEDVYNNQSQISCIDELGLNYYNYARLALVSILDYTKNHQKNLINKLKKPTFYSNKNKLFLGNKALEQLDVIPCNNKPKTLFDVINFTKTVLGKRYLKNLLSNPYANSDEINYNYSIIDLILNLDISDKIAESITEIYDLQKLNRRMELGNINPCELYNSYLSFQNITELMELLEDYQPLLNQLNIDEGHLEKINNCVTYIEDTFNIEYLASINFLNYKEESTNFIRKSNFNQKEFDRLNELEDGIRLGENFMSVLTDKFTKIIESCGEKRFMNSKNGTMVNLKYNDQSGHYLCVTKLRCKKLIEGLKKTNGVTIGNRHIKLDDLEFVDLPRASNTKIFCKEMKNISSNVVELKVMLAKEIKTYFYNEIKNMNEQFMPSILYFTEKVAFIDFINSGAIGAKKLGYFKPEIVNYENSFIDVENIRHPIIEMLNQDSCYQPHNLTIGKDKTGILLYGINSSGKSTLMKALGLNIILAQIGYYTASTKFNYFPYTNLFTRINGNDNIFRGMSSFMVEMIELMSILKRNNKNTLVLADEICRGTEEKSANIIVAYMLETLQESNTSFITATHLHIIAELPSVKNLDRVKPMHLQVTYDEDNETLIYSRKLMDGQGDKYYGVQVAKYLMKNDNFNKRTKELEDEYENVNIKPSNYNKSNWMTKCYICETKNNLETHHINEQNRCVNNMVLDNPHIKKNSNYNLVTLCQKCHDKIDTEEIIIRGWIDTSDGIKLDYSLNEIKKSKKKYTEKEIGIINQFKDKTLKEAKKLLENNKIKISTNTISKIWSNNY